MTQQQIKGRRLTAPVDGRYRLDHQLDEDELVTIWRAHDELLERSVVLKLLHPELLRERVVLDHFQAEAMAVAAISHVNVARRYEVEIRDDVAYTTSEYIDGPALARLSADGPLAIDAVAALGFQAASALAAVHDHDVVHRNVNPQTLVVGTDGRTRLTYFRMPRIPGVGTDGAPRIVDGGGRYLAPEQVRGEPAVGASDVYALGRCLQEAWLGSLEDSLEPTEDGPLVRTLKTLPGVFGDDGAERLREILSAAVALHAEQRPTAHALRDQLEELCGSRGELVLRPLVARDS